MSTVHYSLNLVTPEAQNLRVFYLTDLSINLNDCGLPVCLNTSYTNTLKRSANNVSNSRQEPFMTITHNLHIENSILK